MISTKKIEVLISIVLSIGMIISLALVILGGSIYLSEHGGEKIHFELMQPDVYSTNLSFIWRAAFSLSPLGIIQLGILVLVISQVARVGLLVWFYLSIKDHWFFFISLFVLIVLIYSLLFRN